MSELRGGYLYETVEESGYKLIRRMRGNRLIVLEDQAGNQELWCRNDHHAGYTVTIGKMGYEFMRDYHG
jgi:hypothetical protein